MPVYYLETSVLVKRYRTELGSDVVVELVDRRRPEDSFVTSYFSALEVEATIARALKARLIDQRARGRLLGQFSRELGDIIVPQSVSNHTVLRAIGMARRHRLRSGDAIHLATASLVGGSLDDITSLVFVTSDRELASASTAEQLQVLDLRRPEEAMSLLRNWRER